MKLIPIIQDNKTVYKCTCCDIVYEKLPLCFGADVPALFNTIPENEREERIEMEKSLCVIDKKYFFHRGRLIIPIIDTDGRLIFDAWVSISEENFNKRMDIWGDEDRVKESPYFGWLDTFIPTYGDTLNLRTISQEQKTGFVPDIIMTEEGHPLTIDQQNGITMDKVLDIVSVILKHND